MSEKAPKRDVASAEPTQITFETEPASETAVPVAPVETIAPLVPETPAEPAKKKDWKAYKGVVESTKIDTVDRLDIVAGVNEYKGNHYVFIAKISDSGFQKGFFNLPAYVWSKSIPVLSKYTGSIAEIEKKAMANAVIDELKRLKELGIDIKALAEQL